MKSINPATEEPLLEYSENTSQQIEKRLNLAHEAFVKWHDTPMTERARLIHRVAEILRGKKAEYARLMTMEMGKPIAAAESEVEKCALTCDWFADHAQKMLSPIDMPSDAAKSYVRFDPLGPVLAIMPWNFPFWQVLRFAAPTLMAGNTAVLKHAPNVPGCAVALEILFHEAGFPSGVFVNLLISDNAAAQKLVGDQRIAAVTLTGSERAGAAVAAEAGKYLKKSVMELGGSDPFIVLADVDVDAAAQSAAEARCINNGQSCIAAKRFIVDAKIAERFEIAMAKAMSAMRIGNPLDRSIQIGPLARLDLLENLDRQVRRSLEQGAKLLTGGKRLPGRGFFYEPTVLTNVTPGMTAFDEETFGPVAAVIRANDPDHAVELANQSAYGLGASIWTLDSNLAQKIAEKIQSGSVFINGPVKSDARLPFGGIKHSGWGRELSKFGIREFVNLKTIWIGK